jgi:hypothetical protein
VLLTKLPWPHVKCGHVLAAHYNGRAHRDPLTHRYPRLPRNLQCGTLRLVGTFRSLFDAALLSVQRCGCGFLRCVCEHCDDFCNAYTMGR